MKSFGCQEKFPNILLCPFFINDVDFFHNSRVEYSESTTNILLADPSIWSNDIEISEHCISHFSSGLDDIAISDLRIIDVTLDSKDIVAPYLHGVIFFWGWLEHYHRSLFYHVVISEYYLEVLIFFLANDRACWVYDAPLAKYHIADYLV